MAKIIDTHTIEIQDEKRGDHIDLRNLVKQDFNKNFIEKYIKNELESKEKALKKELSDSITKEIEEKQKEILDLKVSKEVQVFKDEKNDEILKLKDELKDIKHSNELTMNNLKNDHSNILKAQQEKIHKEYQKELDDLKNEKQRKRVKILGIELENYVEKELTDVNNLKVLHKIKSGESGADFIYNVINDQIKQGSIIIECKNAETWKNQWITKIIKDTKESKYKIIVTYASSTPGKKDLDYWIEDAEHHVYVVRPHAISIIVQLLSHIIKKESFIKEISKDTPEDIIEKIQKLDSLINTKILASQKKMIERKDDIDKKCSTIDNATIKIRSQARKMAENDVKEIITSIQSI